MVAGGVGKQVVALFDWEEGLWPFFLGRKKGGNGGKREGRFERERDVHACMRVRVCIYIYILL